jgi:SAM-dependent methyltransferase
MQSEVKIHKNKFGYFEITEKPTVEQLQEYYSKKYYQSGAASYELEYSEKELDYFENKIHEKVFVVQKYTDLSPKSHVLDIGCGEGWVLKYFRKRGIPVIGLDFSSYGCQKFNPDCIEDFIEGDLYENIDKLLTEGKRFDLIWLDNVLEHVLDPLSLLEKASMLLTNDGVLMIEVPNDFSDIQNHLFDKNYVSRKYWIAFPDHLSYFNKEGLSNLAADAGFKNVFSMADFPIEINLLNPNTNYCDKRNVGKSCYHSKVDFENLLHKQKMEDVIKFYSTMIDVGLGRCIISFFIKK